MTSFNKREFAIWISNRLNLPRDEGAMLFDAIGQRIEDSIIAGDTVFLFGQGTLKRVKSRGAGAQTRIRYRPSTRSKESSSTIVVKGLPGVALGVLPEVAVVTSASAGERAILVGRPFLAQGGLGQITVYVDDAGMHRCLIQSSTGAVEEEIVETKAAARRWLKSSYQRIV